MDDKTQLASMEKEHKYTYTGLMVIFRENVS